MVGDSGKSLPRGFRKIQDVKTVLRTLPAVVYAALIFYLSSIPGRDVPHVGINDKVLHFILYAVFGILLMLACPRFWIAVGVGLLYAVSDEWHQSFVPGRAVEVLDVCADVAGVAAASWFFKWLRGFSHD